MDERPRLLICHVFAALPDQRIERHRLLDLLTIAAYAVLTGADNFVEVEEFDLARQAWFNTFLELSNGIPSHDTFGRIFARLDQIAFKTCFLSWVQAIVPRTDAPLAGEAIAVDGKVVRRSHESGAGCPLITLVSTWASETQLILS